MPRYSSLWVVYPDLYIMTVCSHPFGMPPWFPQVIQVLLAPGTSDALARNPNCQLLPSAEEVVSMARGLWLLTSWRLGRIMGTLGNGLEIRGSWCQNDSEWWICRFFFLPFFAQIIPDQELRVRCSNKPVSAESVPAGLLFFNRTANQSGHGRCSSVAWCSLAFWWALGSLRSMAWRRLQHREPLLEFGSWEACKICSSAKRNWNPK